MKGAQAGGLSRPAPVLRVSLFTAHATAHYNPRRPAIPHAPLTVRKVKDEVVGNERRG